MLWQPVQKNRVKYKTAGSKDVIFDWSFGKTKKAKLLVSRYSLISLDSLGVVSTLSDAFFLGKHGPFSIEVLQTDLLILTVEQGS